MLLPVVKEALPLGAHVAGLGPAAAAGDEDAMVLLSVTDLAVRVLKVRHDCSPARRKSMCQSQSHIRNR